jgi:rhodanese-related sulfurtransferase
MIGDFKLVSKKTQSIGTILPEDAFKLIEEHKDDSNLVILDVRPHDEFEVEHIHDAQNLDYDGHEFRKKVEKIDKEKNYIIYCRSGVRGEYFMGIMKELGFPKVYNILGGFAGWKVSHLSYFSKNDKK